MSEWAMYQKIGVTEMRPYLEGEDMTDINLAVGLMPEEGGMVCRAPGAHDDVWYITPEYFREHYEEATR